MTWLIAVAVAAAVAGAPVTALALTLAVRRHGESALPEAGWSTTAEVFRDPVTDRLTRVWIDVAGRRRYVPER